MLNVEVTFSNVMLIYIKWAVALCLHFLLRKLPFKFQSSRSNFEKQG